MNSLEKANKENTSTDKSNGSETPFFARFLEGQLTGANPATAGDKADDGAVIQTLKYPSDRDEWEPLT